MCKCQHHYQTACNIDVRKNQNFLVICELIQLCVVLNLLHDSLMIHAVTLLCSLLLLLSFHIDVVMTLSITVLPYQTSVQCPPYIQIMAVIFDKAALLALSMAAVSLSLPQHKQMP